MVEIYVGICLKKIKTKRISKEYCEPNKCS